MILIILLLNQQFEKLNVLLYALASPKIGRVSNAFRNKIVGHLIDRGNGSPP
jgi:hypothetical protein